MPRTRRIPKAPRETSTPWFPIVLACLFAAGCAAQARRKATIEAASKPRSMGFQVDPTSDLWEPSRTAADDWSKALGRSITVTADGDIPIFRVRGSCHVPVEGEAPDDKFVAACSKDLRTADARIEVSESTAPWELYTTIKHEMGHHLAGNMGHVTNNPDALMYYYKPLGSPNVITKDDVLYVCQGFDCDPSAFAAFG